MLKEERVAVERLKKNAQRLVEQARILWSWNDGKGGYLLEVVEEEFKRQRAEERVSQ